MTAAPLKVLHVLGELRPSGAEVMLTVAAPAFAAHGVTADVLSTGHVPGPYAPRMAAAGYRLLHLPFTKSPAFFFRLWKLLRRGRYDAVHVHTERASFWVGLTALVARRGVVLKSIHSTFAFTGSLRLRRMIQRHLMAWIGIRQIAVGRSVQETERRHFHLEAPLIANWFDGERFRPPTEAERSSARAALGLDPGEVVLALVGNCSPIKNHADLLRAVGRVPSGRRPVLLHAGEEEAGQPERALALELGLGDRIRFMGSLPDVRVVLHAADGYVMSSQREGSSISALEAMATALPAILTDVDGLRDLAAVFPGVRLAAPDAGSLAAAIEAFILEEPEARRRAAATHPALARRHFDMGAGVDAYVRIYRGG